MGAAFTRGGNNLCRILKKVVRAIFLLEVYIVLDILYPLSYNSMYVAKPGNATQNYYHLSCRCACRKLCSQLYGQLVLVQAYIKRQ